MALETTAVVPANFPDRYEAGGTVQARTSATLTSRIVAPVRDVRVVPGQHVHAGQVLVVLDDRDLAAQSRQARAVVAAAEQAIQAGRAERDAADASLALASATHGRLNRLHERKSATTQELDEATASLRAAEARQSAARARTAQADAGLASAQAAAEAAAVSASYATVAAPFDGIVIEKLIDPGNMAAPGAPLVRIDSDDGFRVDVKIDEARAALVTAGTTVSVAVGPREGADAVILPGQVTEVARAIDAGARGFQVKVALPPSPDLRSGMFARVIVDGPPRPALVVPATAIVHRGQVATLFAVEAGAARLRLVQTGRSRDDVVEVLAGVEDGELVVTSPPPGLADGQPLQSLPPRGDRR
jgi:RND family efflux transporter MFP subunit